MLKVVSKLYTERTVLLKYLSKSLASNYIEISSTLNNVIKSFDILAI